ncbi:MAG: YdbL family protein [Desulfobulbaceae bacterium]|nr:YdbL family protein [Desulfobulbaceae bacterium]MCK5544300.1 YdbL family protein [Desulfobulbaceae bacterium]
MKSRMWGFIALLVLIGMTFSLTTTAVADNGIKARMKARLPVIRELKAQGIVGENNQGFLEFLKSADQDQDVVESENSDRRRVYKAIAGQQGSLADDVGRLRATKNSERARPGDMIQNEKGEWIQK